MARRKISIKTSQNSKDDTETCLAKARGNKRSLKQSSENADTKEMFRRGKAMAFESKPGRNIVKGSDTYTAVYKLPIPQRTTKDGDGSRALRRFGKQGLVVDMLTRSNGASLDDLILATGWQPHSTRAVLSRLRKGGHQIGRRRQDGNTRYHLILNPIIPSV